MLASVGQDTLSDIPRFVFNNMNLSDGISFVLVVMATFAMSEALMIILRGTDPSSAAKAISLKELGSIKLDKEETKKVETKDMLVEGGENLTQNFLANKAFNEFFHFKSSKKLKKILDIYSILFVYLHIVNRKVII